MRSSGLPSVLARREISGRWCPSNLNGPRFVARLSESQAQGHVFLGFLSGSQTVVSFRCVLAGAEPELDGDLSVAGGALSLKFWRAVPSGEGKLQLSAFWERDVLERSELLGQFQPRLLFYEFPRENRFQAYFVWDLVDRRGRGFWLVRVLAGRLPSSSCVKCRRASAKGCKEHSFCSMMEMRIKSDRYTDVRRCFRPLSASSVLLLRPHKGLVSVTNFDYIDIPSGPPPLLRVPSFGAPAKLHFGGCTEGVCSRCYQAWACSFRSGSTSRRFENLPGTASVCPLSKKATEPRPNPCSPCDLSEQFALQPACLDLVVNVSGLVDSHDRPNRADDGLTCPVRSAKLLSNSYGHWLRRKCLLRNATTSLEPALLFDTPQKRTACTPMPWLLQNSERYISYASELCISSPVSLRHDEEPCLGEELDFYDLPLLSGGIHLPHTHPPSVVSSLRPPPPPGMAIRIEEVVLALRPMLHRRFGAAPFGPEMDIRVASASPKHVEMVMVPDEWRKGNCVNVLWNLETGAWRALQRVIRPPRNRDEVTVMGRRGSNATWLPDIGARRLQFFPDTLENNESLTELCDDSGILSLRKEENP